MNAPILSLYQQARSTFERLAPQQQLSFLCDLLGGNLGPDSDAWADAIAPVGEAFDAAYGALHGAVDPQPCQDDGYADYLYDLRRDEKMLQMWERGL